MKFVKAQISYLTDYKLIYKFKPMDILDIYAPWGAIT